MVEDVALELFINGVKQFNIKNYYDSHESFEDIWSNHHLDDRVFVQALIQLAVAYFHITNNNKNGAIGLFKKSLKKLDNYIDQTDLIININDVIESAHSSYVYLQGIDSMDKFNWELAPKLELRAEVII